MEVPKKEKGLHPKMIRLKKGQVLLTFIFMLLGALMAFQYNQVSLSGKQQNVGTEYRYDVETELQLQEELLRIREENQKLEEQLALLQAETAQMEESLTAHKGTIEMLYEELEKTRMMAAMVPVTGPGLVIVLNDSPLAKTVPPEEKDNYLVHVEDLRAVVNDLFLAGAEAIAINGQRLGPVSSLRCIGPVIYVNGKQMAPPFKIEAIGPADVLETAMNLPGGILDVLRDWQLEVSVKKADNLQLAAMINEERVTPNLLEKASESSDEPRRQTSESG
ncbi:MAG: DUF881 domain-containing protein [Bacillota bacterium]|nr:hypothetical protein [Bacillota bacterium]